MVNILLAFLRVKSLEIFFVINTLSYLVVTLLFVYLNKKVRGALGAVSAILFGCFMVLVILRVIRIIA